ncbi:MAG: response regulator [Armatimonadota bacterium]|nr:response regulator [Armatimonadota bacterium]MDR7574109.1 response regulator [Armatimonadota bacterium]
MEPGTTTADRPGGERASSSAPRRPTRILCVDDDPRMLEILREFLSAEGYEVLVAGDGAQALQQVRRAAPEAIVLDLFMPGLGGLSVLERIRETLPECAVVVISGIVDAIELVRNSGLEAPALAKPFSLEDLLAALAQAGVAFWGEATKT